MAARENLPKIVKDIQDIVTDLCEEFKTSSDPITDDNHTLHRLCAKLEFLLSSCTKDKSLMGNRKDYWHWAYACLKNNKGLCGGLKYVQANKEVRLSKGRGRAFIRYCLVHQTLADSLQNCIMNRSITRQYYTSDSILVNPTYSSALITSLYDLNAVNFDLNSKGYDLDTGWPTFASKRNVENSMIDHWAIRSHVGSLSSYPAPSVVMDTPRMHGSGSSGPHSVDQRVEELVLELDQSDQKIKEQQEIIMDLESKAENVAKSTNEKEDILAGVISDLEAKNRHLHVAMSDMSSEFQAREQQWSEKHTDLMKDLTSTKSKNSSLQSKISQLEEDKRTLEDLVSQKMSSITSSFVQVSDNEILTPVTSLVMDQTQQSFENDLREARNKNKLLSEEFEKSREHCIELQHRVNELSANDLTSSEELFAELKEKQNNIDRLQQEITNLTTNHQLFVNNVRDALSLNEAAEPNVIVLEVLKLRDQCTIEIVKENHQVDGALSVAVSLKEENEYLKLDRDVAQSDVDNLKHKLKSTHLEVDKLTVELESSKSDSINRIRELEETLSICQDQLEKQKRQHTEMLSDLKLTQDALHISEKELDEAKQRCNELEKKQRALEEKWVSTKLILEEEIKENEDSLEQIKIDMKHYISLNETLDRQLENEKTKSNHLSVDLLTTKSIADSFSKQLIETSKSVGETETTLSELQAEVKRLHSMESSHQQIINSLSNVIEQFLEKAKEIDGADDVESFELLEDDFINEEEENNLNEWKNLGFNFKQILEAYKSKKDELKKLRSEVSKLRESSASYQERMECDVGVLKEQLAETLSGNEIHLVTIKDLTDKLKASQDGKTNRLKKIENLEYELNDNKEKARASEKVADDLRLRIMDESAQRLNAEEKIKNLEQDIESLKDKITQLLLDKDTLWKEGESLRDRLHDQSDIVEEINWVDDHEVVNCQHCNNPFSLANRKHHCRKCGKVFCKICCNNWKYINKIQVRVCDSCFNSPDLDMSNLSLERSNDWSTPKSSSPFTPSKEYDELRVEEASPFDLNHSSINNGDSRHNVENENLSETRVVVAARREYHVPVEIERPGMTLYWEISSDRDINFKLCYAVTEEDTMSDLVPIRRINSHVEPFIGNLVARKEGVYTLVLDNTFSRLTSKNVTYKLGIVLNDSELPS